jgi:hypothetical protein
MVVLLEKEPQLTLYRERESDKESVLFECCSGFKAVVDSQEFPFVYSRDNGEFLTNVGGLVTRSFFFNGETKKTLPARKCGEVFFESCSQHLREALSRNSLILSSTSPEDCLFVGQILEVELLRLGTRSQKYLLEGIGKSLYEDINLPEEFNVLWTPAGLVRDVSIEVLTVEYNMSTNRQPAFLKGRAGKASCEISRSSYDLLKNFIGTRDYFFLGVKKQREVF